MILAEKITEERKKLGLSQEELAEKLSVSRQAVSKWEGAQSIPDLQKIVAMSELFSVTTDYLLKDDACPEMPLSDESAPDRLVRRVSMEEANAFLSMMESGSRSVALGVVLCILCPVLLIFLNGLAVGNVAGITQTLANVAGLSQLFLFVASAVFIFIRYGSSKEPFDYLEKEEFDTAYGVTSLVKEKKAAYQPLYSRCLALGIVLCVLSPLPLIVASLISEDETLVITLTALLLCLVALGVYMIVRTAQVKSSYQILLQEGDYNKIEKKKNKAADTPSGIYWCVVTSVYLAWSFLTDDWKSTWIVWPVAGVLFAPFSMIVKQLAAKKGGEQ